MSVPANDCTHSVLKRSSKWNTVRRGSLKSSQTTYSNSIISNFWRWNTHLTEKIPLGEVKPFCSLHTCKDIRLLSGHMCIHMFSVKAIKQTLAIRTSNWFWSVYLPRPHKIWTTAWEGFRLVLIEYASFSITGDCAHMFRGSEAT